MTLTQPYQTLQSSGLTWYLHLVINRRSILLARGEFDVVVLSLQDGIPIRVAPDGMYLQYAALIRVSRNPAQYR